MSSSTYLGLIIVVIFCIIVFLTIKVKIERKRRRKLKWENPDQQELDQYISGKFSPAEVGKLYERYIGHLYEIEGYDVVYNGALDTFFDRGRDLIVKSEEVVFIIQTKCWSKEKTIHEKHIFQIYGSMMHYALTEELNGREVKPVMFTSSAKYSDRAREVADILGVNLETKIFSKRYPMIKCNVSVKGEKIFHLPTDLFYDKIKIKSEKGAFYAYSVQEALDKGFRRARRRSEAA